MLKNFFLNLFPNLQLSSRAGIAVVLLLALSPIAYLASLKFIAAKDPNLQVGFEINRREAIQIAARYAATLGVNTAGWTHGCKAEANNDRYFYFRQHQGREIESIRRMAPEAFVRVMFVSPDGKENIEVLLAPDGHPLGFTRKPLANQESNYPGEEAARARAESAFRAVELKDVAAQLEAPTLSEERNYGDVTRRYSWRYRLTNFPELDLRIIMTVLGDTIIAQEVTSKFDNAYASRNFTNRQIPAKVALGIYFLLIFVAVCYGFYRYVQRTRQKEVPHARSLLLFVTVASAFMFVALQTDFEVFGTASSGDTTIVYWIIVTITGMFFLLLGLVFGLAYGSGEGDVRESYPGKLTSLDALITGKIFSRNVARAVCTGCALGGWALLSESIALLPWVNHPGARPGISEHMYSILFGNFTWLLPLVNPLLGSLMIAVLGILFPLSLLHRRFRSAKLSLAILVLLSLIANLGVFQEQPLPLAAGLMIAAGRTGILLLAFFVFDLLTAIITLTAATLVTFVVYIVAQPALSFQRAGFTALGLALVFLLVEIYFVYRGREYREEEVRPLYARHLAERLGLQAEVSTAREAQIRLMPQALPHVPGLSIAASCYPSRVVGGDFYDLFTLDRERLGIFVAEGGGRGLAAALTIAYAKGFLMPRIFSTYSPTEIVCSLQAQLAPMSEEDEEMAFAYAVINTSERTLAYARTGRYPQVLIDRGRTNDDADRQSQLRAEEVESQISFAPEGGTNCIVHEATLALAGGDAVLFFTDGVAKSLKIESQTSEGWISSIVSGADHASGELLQKSLDKALAKKSRRAKKIGIEDDLTAVIVRLELVPKVG